MEKLIELYKSILKAASMVVDNDGLVSLSYGGKLKPAIVKGKRLAIPTREVLGRINDSLIVFHPLHENVMLNGETDVVSKLRTSLNFRLDYSVGLLFVQLIDIAINTADHNKLTPDQSEFLSCVKSATPKTLENLRKMLTEGATLVNIYCKRTGKIGDSPFKRVGVINFPLYKELQEKKDKHFGVSLSNKDRETLMKLYQYVFPNIDKADYYNRGSNSMVAPYMDSLMHAVMAVGIELNDKVYLFENRIGDITEYAINAEWVDAFVDLDKLLPIIRTVPMQNGNMTVAEPAVINPAPGVHVTAETKPATVAPDNGLVIRGSFANMSNPPAITPPAIYVPSSIPQANMTVYQPQQQTVSLSQLYGNSQSVQGGFNQNQNFGFQQPPRPSFNNPTVNSGGNFNGGFNNNFGNGIPNAI